MNSDINKLSSLAKSLGAANAAVIGVESIRFEQEFKKLCERNSCGSYNKNWMCPPAVGSINELQEKILKFKQGLLFQTVYQLEDSFDWEGIQESSVVHTKLFRKILDTIKRTYRFRELLPLNVGPCTYCSKCAYLDSQECRFPEEAVASVEAAGIDVVALVKSYGIPYNNGKDTVSCVSLILIKPD